MDDLQAVRERFASCVGGELEITRRDTRWLALGRDIVAFAADEEVEWRRLELEHWLIDRWRAGGVPAPRVLREDAPRRIQVRERMHGLHGEQIHREHGDGSPLYAGPLPSVRERLDTAPLSQYGARLADSYGELAARIRRAVPLADAAAIGIGPTSHRGYDLDALLVLLDETAAPDAIKATAKRVQPWLAALPPIDSVIHGDLHFHNMCTDPTGAITGVFDLGDAGLDAAATELLYVESLGAEFAARVIAAYGPVAVDDVRRAHVRVALEHLVWHRPGTPRHPNIVAWVVAVIERLS